MYILALDEFANKNLFFTKPFVIKNPNFFFRDLLFVSHRFMCKLLKNIKCQVVIDFGHFFVFSFTKNILEKSRKAEIIND